MTTAAVQPPPPTNPAQLLDDRTKGFILLGTMLGLFLSALDQTIVATALPRITQELQGLSLYAWVTTAYLLTSTATVPIYGKLSDLYGRRPILVFGIVVFLLGSVLCGLAGSAAFGDAFGGGMLQLVVFRAFQGIGAGAFEMGMGTRFGAGNPLAAPVGHRCSAVERQREFERHMRSSEALAGQETGHAPRCLGRAGPDRHVDARRAQPIKSNRPRCVAHIANQHARPTRRGYGAFCVKIITFRVKLGWIRRGYPRNFADTYDAGLGAAGVVEKKLIA